MAKKQNGNGESEVKRADVVDAAVDTLKGVKKLAGASVKSCKVEDGSRLRFKLDNGFEVRARIKASRIK